MKTKIVDCDVLFEKCAKFRGSRVIVGLVLWCRRVFEGPTFFLVGFSRKLRVASYKFKYTNDRDQIHEIRVKIWELRVQIYELQVQIH